ncbi:heme ABC transporter ATP-binding protein [Haloprofundus sp. MHR1]|uniref:heme ABC transporter ATP-binding protein n=1 Tax=Haloprofundus sp. MHR1 TaxID=2572921 RepID=UPI0026A4AEED
MSDRNGKDDRNGEGDAETTDADITDAETPDAAIRVDDLAVELGGVSVLDGVDATVERGAFVGLVGPNGAGKTTLLRSLSGLIRPDRGSVAVDGVPIAGRSSKAVSRLVATVPQDTSLSFDFDVRETVAMGRSPHLGRFERFGPEDERAVDDAMERTEVTQFADRSVTAVSGGERQRVLLARALAQDAPVLLLDEPTASLDINHQVRTLELVRDLVASGKTVVAAIHDLNLAAHYCDDLLLLGDGRVLAAGDPQSVLTEANLETAFGANAVVSRHPVTGSVYVTALPDDPRRDRGDEGRVHVVGGGGSAARLLYLLDAAGYDVSVGALNEGDSDTETARSLGLDAVTVPPFAAVDDEARAAVESRIREADVTVVADVEVGEGNRANLEAVRPASSVVLVEERPFAERNYAGPAVAETYAELRARATVVSPSRVVGAVAAAVDESRDATDAAWSAQSSQSSSPSRFSDQRS